MRIDLHVHSNASDGTDAPAEVVRRAAAAGLDVVALTDHDTHGGHRGGGGRASAGADPGPRPGAVLRYPRSCGPRRARSVHLLGYLFDPGDPALAAETALIRDDRTHRAQAMVARLAELGAHVTWEQVSAIAGDAVVGRPHIARALAAAGVVATPADAFTAEWIADGGRALRRPLRPRRWPAGSPWSAPRAAFPCSPTPARRGTRSRTRSSRGWPPRAWRP